MVAHDERGSDAACIKAISENLWTPSEEMPEDALKIEGYDFENGRDLDSLMDSMLYSGFQATHLGQAVEEVNRMIKWRLSDDPVVGNEYSDPDLRSKTRTKIFLGYTSNMVSAGVREQIRYLVQNRCIDVMVTTTGGIEEDLMKCMLPTFVGDFKLKGSELHKKGLNRIGNMILPNNNYCAFADWMTPILDAMLKEQKEDNVNWTPSKMIRRFGKEINNPKSIYYWAYKHDIPVFCPALTDGSIGDLFYLHSYKNPGLRCDIIEDIRRLDDQTLKAAPQKTGIIILGGGVPKHHICNANLLKNGADFSVFINTAQEFDGCDSGAHPDEAVSWGKIGIHAKPVKVIGDATILFPLLVSQTFAKHKRAS